MVSLLVFVASIFLAAQGIDVCSWFFAKDCYYNPGCHIVNGLCVTDPCWEVSSTETTITQCSNGPTCKYHVYINEYVVNEEPTSYPIEYCTTGERFVHDFCHLYYAEPSQFVNANCTYMSPMPGCGSTHTITLTDGGDFTFCTRNGLEPYDTHDSCHLFSAQDCKYNPACEVAGGVCVPDRCFEDLDTAEELARGCILGNQCTVHSLTVNSKDYEYCTNGSRDEVDLCHSVWGTPSEFNETKCFGLLGGNWCKGKVTITVNETPITFCTKEYIPSDGGDKGKKKNVAAAIVIPIVVVVVVVVVVIVIVVVVKRKQGYKNLSDGSNTYLK